MSAARDYLNELCARHPILAPSKDEAEAVLRELDLPLQAERIEFSPDSRTAGLVAELHEALPAVVHQLLQADALVIGEIGHDDPAAYLDILPDSQFAIVLHSGLCRFLYRIARPLASTLFRTEDAPDTGIAPPELARIVAEVFWWQQNAGREFGPEYDISQEQKKLASMLTSYTERFLLAHEISHVVFAMSAADNEAAKEIDGTTEEQFADLFALNLTLNASIEKDEEPNLDTLMLAYAGAELALQIWGIMEQLGIAFVDGVHPPSAQRIAALRSALRQQCETEDAYRYVLMVSSGIEKVFDDVVQIINRPGEYNQTYENEANAVAVELGRLLHQCSQEAVPDYMSFYDKAPAILSRGYPETVLSRIFNEAFNEFNEILEASGEADANGLRSKTNRYKLLFGLAERMPEPAKSLYRYALTGIAETS